MKTVVVMAGGGSKGAFQVGVLKALLEKGYKFNAAYGTSTGGLQSAGLAHAGIDALENVWLNIENKKDIFKFNWSTLILNSDGLYSTKPLRKKIDAITQAPATIPATVCKINLITGEKVYATSGDPDFPASVEASACVPLGTSPVDGIWVDGGVREIAPLKIAIKQGADKIIVILTNPWNINPTPWGAPTSNFLKLFKIGMRAVDILGHETLVNDMEQCLKKNGIEGYKTIELEIYAPTFLVSKTNEFNPKKIRKAIEHGYEIAQSGPNVKL